MSRVNLYTLVMVLTAESHRAILRLRISVAGLAWASFSNIVPARSTIRFAEGPGSNPNDIETPQSWQHSRTSVTQAHR